MRELKSSGEGESAQRLLLISLPEQVRRVFVAATLVSQPPQYTQSPRAYPGASFGALQAASVSSHRQAGPESSW
jgi:hypothetical protein